MACRSPYSGEKVSPRNPDGSRLQVRAWGNQYAAVFETLDGYGVTRDPDTGFYDYATVSPDKQELVPTGIRVGDIEPPSSICRGTPAAAASA
jgi:hypothetical protein